MKHIVISLISLWFFSQTCAFGNPFAWADTVGGKGMSRGKAMAIDKNNNLFVCGEMNGSFHPCNVTINGKNDFLMKYNEQGALVWATALPGLVCTCVEIDRYGNECVAGYFSDTVQIGKLKLESAGLNDFFILKFDSLGNLFWGIRGGGAGNDYAFSLSCDVGDHINITGSFEDYFNFDPYTSFLSLGKGDMFVAQYDSAGRFVWAASGGGNAADAGTAIGTDLYGDVFVTGYFNKTATFHNNHIQSTGGNNMYIVKFSPLGYQLSVHTVNCGGDVVPNAMGLDGSGNVYLCGNFNGTAVFGSKSITGNSNDGFVAAYDNSLNLNWLNQIGGSGNEDALGIVADWTSNIFVTGVFTGSADINGSILISKGSTDIFIVKYDAAGRVLWKERAGGVGADSAFAICVDRNDVPVITGFISTKADFGEFTLDADQNGSFFIAQLKANPAGIDIPNHNNAGLFEIYPNPSRDIFNIEETGITNEPLLMSLTDAKGRIISIENQILWKNNRINLHDYPDGIYFLTLITGSGNHTQKIVKTGN